MSLHHRRSSAAAEKFQASVNPLNERRPAITLRSSHLIERAVIAAKQMRYFQLFTQRASFVELGASARRAGFAPNYEDFEHKEASFRWAVGKPDFLFFVTFEHLERISVVAEAYGDIFGLVMLSYPHLPHVSVELKTALKKHELGLNTLRLREILLEFPDFEVGKGDKLPRFALPCTTNA